jgi:hypothetical protein
MARRLLRVAAMSTLILVLALLGLPIAANAQSDALPADGMAIDSAQVAGFPSDQLSPGLRRDIDALSGQAVSRDQLQALAARIEGEHPDVVAAVRHVVLPAGSIRIVFLVARIGESESLVENINARYVVDHVQISGIPDRAISRELLDELQALVGKPLDSVEAERLERKLEAELPDYDVERDIDRGADSGLIRIDYRVSRSERSRWLRFMPSRSKVIYHEDQGWSGVIDVSLGGRRNSRVTFGVVMGNADDLVEEYSGFRFRVENRNAGTERLGLSFEVSRLTADWRDVTLSTLLATADGPQAYRTRVTVQPLVMFAITRHLRAGAGVSASELDPLAVGGVSERVNAAIASIGYDQTWRDGNRTRQDIAARYEVHAGTEGLDSDLVYRRHVGHARYRTEYRKSAFIADFRAGRITGRAPLFERFTLGDSATLRGWSKYDIAPAGADRMWHQSVEFRFRGLAYFLDAGSVWNVGDERKIRLGTGIGFHVDDSFVTLAFPLNADDVRATFMLGVRF